MKSVSFMALAFAAGLSVGVGSAAAEELKANHYLPPKHPVATGYEAFAEAVEKESGGDLTVKIFGGGSLLGAKATVDGLRDGVADVGFIVNTYFPAQFPHGRLTNDLSMVGDDGQTAAFAITEQYTLHCDVCREEYAQQNTVYLGTTSTPPYVIISAAGDLNSLEALRGKKLRAGGALWTRWAAFLGATGVSVPSSDIYEGLERGVVDAAIYAAGGLKTHSLADVADNVIQLPVGMFRSDNLFAFNRDRWSGLTTEQRKALLRATAVGVVASNVAYLEGDKEGLKLAKQQDIPILEPAPELVEARNKFVSQDVAATAERAKAEYGIKDPDGFIEKYRELYAKYEPLVDPIRDNPEKMVDLLWQEVYSKVDPATYGVK